MRFYEIEIIIATAVNIMSILLVGLIFGAVIESIIFFITFAVLRSSSGGYHANTYFKCNLVLVANVVMVLLIYNIVQNSSVLLAFGILVNLITLTVTYFVVPVESENKPLTNSQKKKLKAKYLIIEIICIVLWVILVLADIRYSVMISLSLTSVTLSLIKFKMRNKNDEKQIS